MLIFVHIFYMFCLQFIFNLYPFPRQNAVLPYKGMNFKPYLVGAAIGGPLNHVESRGRAMRATYGGVLGKRRKKRRCGGCHTFRNQRLIRSLIKFFRLVTNYQAMSLSYQVSSASALPFHALTMYSWTSSYRVHHSLYAANLFISSYFCFYFDLT